MSTTVVVNDAFCTVCQDTVSKEEVLETAFECYHCKHVLHDECFNTFVEHAEISNTIPSCPMCRSAATMQLVRDRPYVPVLNMLHEVRKRADDGTDAGKSLDVPFLLSMVSAAISTHPTAECVLLRSCGIVRVVSIMSPTSPIILPKTCYKPFIDMLEKKQPPAERETLLAVLMTLALLGKEATNPVHEAFDAVHECLKTHIADDSFARSASNVLASIAIDDFDATNMVYSNVIDTMVRVLDLHESNDRVCEMACRCLCNMMTLFVAQQHFANTPNAIQVLLRVMKTHATENVIMLYAAETFMYATRKVESTRQFVCSTVDVVDTCFSVIENSTSTETITTLCTALRKLQSPQVDAWVSSKHKILMDFVCRSYAVPSLLREVLNLMKTYVPIHPCLDEADVIAVSQLLACETTLHTRQSCTAILYASDPRLLCKSKMLETYLIYTLLTSDIVVTDVLYTTQCLMFGSMIRYRRETVTDPEDTLVAACINIARRVFGIKDGTRGCMLTGALLEFGFSTDSLEAVCAAFCDKEYLSLVMECIRSGTLSGKECNILLRMLQVVITTTKKEDLTHSVLVGMGIVPALIKLKADFQSDISVLVQLFVLVQHLGSSLAQNTLMGKEGVVEMVLQCLANFMYESEDVTEAALRCLVVLCASPPNRARAERHNVVYLLVQTLIHFGLTSPSVAKACCRALSLCTENRFESTLVATALGAIPAVAAFVMNSTTDSVALGLACNTLGCLAMHNDENKRVIMDTGIVPPMLNGVSSQNALVARRCAWTLGCLARLNSNRLSLIQAGALYACVCCLETHTRSFHVIKNVCWALTSLLSCDTLTSCGTALSSRLLTSLLAIFPTTSDEESVEFVCISVLRVGNFVPDMFVDMGCQAMVAEAATTFPGSDIVKSCERLGETICAGQCFVRSIM